jgi:hypothetical protein
VRSYATNLALKPRGQDYATLPNHHRSAKGNLPTLHCMRRAHHPPIAVAIQSIANHSAFPALIVLGELSAGPRPSLMIGH